MHVDVNISQHKQKHVNPHRRRRAKCVQCVDRRNLKMLDVCSRTVGMYYTGCRLTVLLRVVGLCVTHSERQPCYSFILTERDCAAKE